MLQASRIFKAARTWTVVAIGGASTFSSAVAQTQPVDHAAAYYHYSLGHMYADLEHQRQSRVHQEGHRKL